jgi:hypothetical protein
VQVYGMLVQSDTINSKTPLSPWMLLVVPF